MQQWELTPEEWKQEWQSMRGKGFTPLGESLHFSDLGQKKLLQEIMAHGVDRTLGFVIERDYFDLLCRCLQGPATKPTSASHS